MGRRTVIRIKPSAHTVSSANHSTSSNTNRSLLSRRYFKTSSVAMYSGVFLLILSVVAVGYQPPEHSSASASAVELASSRNPSPAPTADELVATNVAANIAGTADLPVSSNVANLSQSLTAQSVLTQSDTNVVAKPQIVEPTADSREIRTYKTKSGDTAPAVAQKFGISAETVKWANDIDSDALEPNKELRILPVDGVIIKAGDGDTLDSIASKYDANPEQLKNFNDLEISGVVPGQELIIPSGELPEADRPGYTEPTTSATTANGTSSGSSSSTVVDSSIANASAGNRYAFGNCTWYAYERRAQLGRPIGSFWGNANTWSMYAQSAGFKVNNSPAVGAIMEGGGSTVYGHVAVVESVNGDSFTVSEMNYVGFNVVSERTIPMSQAGSYRFIH